MGRSATPEVKASALPVPLFPVPASRVRPPQLWSTTKVSVRPSTTRRLHLANSERTQRHPRCSGKEPDLRCHPHSCQRDQPDLPADHRLFQASSRLAGQRSASHRACDERLLQPGPLQRQVRQGRLPLDCQQNANYSWFLRISDRKKTGVNFPALPLPLDGQTNGTIRVLVSSRITTGPTLFG